MPQVVIVQRRLPHYRESFFEALRTLATQRGVELKLVHGNPTDDEASKQDSGHLTWAHFARCRYALGGRLCWQNVSSHLDDADLVIVTSENRLLYNHLLQWRRRPFRLAFWGHGANFQGDAHSWRERFKAYMARRVDWWFAYTDMSRQALARVGFPADRITVVNNAVDTVGLQRLHSQVRLDDVATLRREHGLVGHHVGVFVGSLYAEKRIGFLLAAARKVRERVADFELLVVGAGPDQAMVQDFAREHPWCHHLGPRSGRDKVIVLAAAQVMLNPGLVGLGILDSFVCALPMVTTDCGLHSPEIAYLESGTNGLMTPDDLWAYADAIVRLLSDGALAERLRAGCARSAPKYTVVNMAERFLDGLEACLAAPRLR
jgi:glycosyltransferase involved in cell wall biosynthesis